MNDFISPDLLAAHPEWVGGNQVQPIPNATPNEWQGAMQPIPNATPSNGQMPAGTPLVQPASSYNGPAITPPAFSGSGGMAQSPQQGLAATNQWQATKDLLKAREFEVQSNVKTLPIKSEVLKAQQNVLSKQEADISANRSYLDEQLRANEARRAEKQAIIAASNDPEDIKKTAKATREQDSEDYLFQLAGMPAPLRVKMPAGYTGKMPPGTLIAVQSLADILTEKSSDAEEMRKFNLEAARIKSANTGLDVTAAQIAKGRVELTLDEAQLAAEAAGWVTAQHQINYDKAKLPPTPGLVLDDSTGEWTTPEVAYINQSLARDKAKNAILGTFGSIPADTLMSMATQDPPTITDSQLREGLIAQGMSPSAADEYVKLAAARRASKKEEDDLNQWFRDRQAAQGNTGATPPPVAGSTTSNGGAYSSGGAISTVPTPVAPRYQSPGNSGGTAFR